MQEANDIGKVVVLSNLPWLMPCAPSAPLACATPLTIDVAGEEDTVNRDVPGACDGQLDCV
jgi:hypothetical protein